MSRQNAVACHCARRIPPLLRAYHRRHPDPESSSPSASSASADSSLAQRSKLEQGNDHGPENKIEKEERGRRVAGTKNEAPELKPKTMAQRDEELRMKLEGRSGGGGEAGLELEGGKPVAMGRGTKENMFRVI